MSNKKRTVLTVVALVLVCALSIAGTLAYLTKESNKVTNTFAAAGLVDGFKLEEREVKEDTASPGSYDYVSPEKWVTSNNYANVIPNTTLPKDPTVKYDELKVNSYLYVKASTDTITEQGITWEMDSAWTGIDLNNDGKNDIYYQSVDVDPSNKAKAYNVIKNKTLTVAGTYAATTSGTLEFEAYLVQREGFANATAAWNATYGAPAQP